MTTPNFGWVLPVVGGDTNIWGTILNDLLGDPGTAVANIDADLQAVKDVADANAILAAAALPKAGGVMTGQLHTYTSIARTQSHGLSTGALDLDVSLANWWESQPPKGSTINFNIINADPQGGVVEILLISMFDAGSSTITWSSEGGEDILWVGSAAPALSVDAIDLVGFWNATSSPQSPWRGALLQRGII